MPSKRLPKKCMAVFVVCMVVCILFVPIVLNYETWHRILTVQLPHFVRGVMKQEGGVLVCTAFLIALIFLVATVMPRPSTPPSDALSKARFVTTSRWLTRIHHFVLPVGICKQLVVLVKLWLAQEMYCAGFVSGMFVFRIIPVLLCFVLPTRWHISSAVGFQRFIECQVISMTIVLIVLRPAMEWWFGPEHEIDDDAKQLLMQYAIRYFFESIIVSLVWQESCLSSCLCSMWRCALCMHVGHSHMFVLPVSGAACVAICLKAALFNAWDLHQTVLTDERNLLKIFENVKGVVVSEITIGVNETTIHAVHGDSMGVFGYTAQEMVGSNGRAMFHEDDASKICDAFRERPGQAQTLHYRKKRKDGTFVQLRVWTDMQLHANGMMLVREQDISDELDASRLRKQEKQNKVLREIYTQMPGAIVFEVTAPATPHERHQWVAGATEDVLGYTHDEWKDTTNVFQVILHGDSKQEANQIIAAVAGGHTAPACAELTWLHKNGHLVKMLVDKTTRKLPNGNFLFVLHDATDAVNLREMTKQRDIQKALAQRFKRGCHFLSHEIRNKYIQT